MNSFMHGIKNIIFDFGGVIMNIDFRLTIEAFINLGAVNFSNDYNQISKDSLITGLEKGTVSPERFRNEIREKIVPSLSDQDIDSAWNALLLDIPPDRIDCLKKLKQRYPLFLLSNTNIIHHKHFSNYLQEKYNLAFSSLFTKAYFSFDLGMIKPQLEIYHLVIQENKLDPQKTLFIDDSEDNIRGAKQAGLQTYLLKAPMHISLLFQ